MIQSISIENYRCFHNTHLEGFRLLNLIGGKNNAGKTALLEVIYILQEPTPETILNIRKMRGESDKMAEEYPQNMWDDFFYQRVNTLRINISQIAPKVNISDKLFQKEISIFQETLGNTYLKIQTDLLPLMPVNRGRIGRISVEGNLKSYSYKKNINLNNKTDSANYTHPFYKYELFDAETISLLPSRGFILTDKKISELYTKARKKEEETENLLLEGFQAIQSNIDKVEILVDAEPTLYVRSKGDKTRPLKMYGDAMNRIAEFILRIVNNPNSTLLIDEIENGIHHDTQRKIWEILFTLAIRHKVQIFATTHSLEMIKAFESVARKHKEEAMYVEMYKSDIDGEIGASFHEIDLLDYELKNQLEMRGGTAYEKA